MRPGRRTRNQGGAQKSGIDWTLRDETSNPYGAPRPLRSRDFRAISNVISASNNDRRSQLVCSCTCP